MFFGRTQETARAVDLWREAGARETPFLIVIGASGSGIVARARRRHPAFNHARRDRRSRSVARRGDAPQRQSRGPFASLAAALMQGESELSRTKKAAARRCPKSQTATAVRPSSSPPCFAPGQACGADDCQRASARRRRRARARGARSRAALRSRLADRSARRTVFRRGFAGGAHRLVKRSSPGLVRTARVWLIVTSGRSLRQASRTAGAQGAQRTRRDLRSAPPNAAGLAEILRAPAEAADISYEADPTTGETLDTRILRDADRPDMLPLVQLALQRLFEGRVQREGKTLLSNDVYRGLGGLAGIVDDVGEKALATLSEAAKARLPRLLRQLAVPGGAGEPSRAVKYQGCFPPGVSCHS